MENKTIPPQLENARTSVILHRMLSGGSEGDISVGEFMAQLGERAFALAILIFALPNSLPLPGIPGFSTLTGVPIILLGLQLAIGQEVIWLPKKVAQQRFSRSSLYKIIEKTLPFIIWLEKFLKPRFLWIGHPVGERAVGLVIVVLALILALPVPGGNFLPGLSICILALAILERDGLIGALGLLFVASTMVFMIKLIIGAFHIALKWSEYVF